MSMKTKFLCLVLLLSCVTAKPVAAPTTPAPLTAAEQQEIDRQDELVHWNTEVAQRTFDELMRDIEEDLRQIHRVAKCIEDESKSYYDCNKDVTPQPASQP